MIFTLNAIRVRKISTFGYPFVSFVRFDFKLVFVFVFGIEKENLCLYGHPNESWEVNLPAEEVPPELPEPALGINFARDGMQRKDWLSLVAVHSDCWLLSVSFYFGARLNRNERYFSFNLLFSSTITFSILIVLSFLKPKSALLLDFNGFCFFSYMKPHSFFLLCFLALLM